MAKPKKRSLRTATSKKSIPVIPKKKKGIQKTYTLKQADLFKTSIPDPKTVQPPKRIKPEEQIFRETFKRQSEAEKRQKVFQAATKKFKPKAEEKGNVVFLRAHNIPVRGRAKKGEKVITVKGKKYYPAGERLPKTTRQKVFAIRVTESGKAIPYYDWKEKGGYEFETEDKGKKVTIKTTKKLPPKPTSIKSMDLRSFKSKKITKQFYGETMGRSTPETIKRTRGQKSLDYVEQVAPRVANVLKGEADRNKAGRNFAVECSAQVKADTGEMRTVNFEVGFKQADMQQFMHLGFYEPFVSRKLYAEFAEQLKDLGLVTTGSAEYIEQLPVNDGIDDPAEWRDSKGMKWKNGRGHLLKQVNLIRFDAIPKLVMIRTK